jgi:starvation-inducible DNA-binding protein
MVPASVSIGLSEVDRKAVIGILNRVLADEFLLHTKTRRFHWNVEGPHFSALHALFQKQYEELEVAVDDVAERVRTLGGVATGTLEEYLELARLNEERFKSHDDGTMIASLLADHEQLIRALRVDMETCSEDFGDEGTMDFLIGLMQMHEKMAWILRAHLR